MCPFAGTGRVFNFCFHKFRVVLFARDALQESLEGFSFFKNFRLVPDGAQVWLIAVA